MKNFKKIALTAIVAALAVGFSAFTNVHAVKFVKHARVAKAGMITADFIVQPSENNFAPLSSTPVEANCGTPATRSCVYDVTTEGQSNIPNQASYTAEEIDGYVSDGWLAADPSSSNALYQPGN